jgi:hypothetical protein
MTRDRHRPRRSSRARVGRKTTRSEAELPKAPKPRDVCLEAYRCSCSPNSSSSKKLCDVCRRGFRCGEKVTFRGMTRGPARSPEARFRMVAPTGDRRGRISSGNRAACGPFQSSCDSDFEPPGRDHGPSPTRRMNRDVECTDAGAPPHRVETMVFADVLQCQYALRSNQDDQLLAG